MSDLPSPESFKRSGVTLNDAKPILRAYVLGRLRTLEEWIDVFIEVSASGYHDTTQDVFDDMRIGGSDEK